jgi:hypothetical protein
MQWPAVSDLYYQAWPGNFDGQGQPDNVERLLPISLHDQNVALVEPSVQFAEAASSGLRLQAQIPAQERQDDIAGVSTTRGAGQRHPLCSETAGLESMNDSPLDTGTLVS